MIVNERKSLAVRVSELASRLDSSSYPWHVRTLDAIASWLSRWSRR